MSKEGIMSLTSILLPKKNPARTPAARRPVSQTEAASRLRTHAEDLLRELAFVYQAVDAIRQSIKEGAGRAAAQV
jgi:hypothetical protein